MGKSFNILSRCNLAVLPCGCRSCPGTHTPKMALWLCSTLNLPVLFALSTAVHGTKTAGAFGNSLYWLELPPPAWPGPLAEAAAEEALVTSSADTVQGG